jgi:hypothetical protein
MVASYGRGEDPAGRRRGVSGVGRPDDPDVQSAVGELDRRGQGDHTGSNDRDVSNHFLPSGVTGMTAPTEAPHGAAMLRVF